MSEEHMTKIEMLERSGQTKRSREEWLRFADAMFQKALDHLKKYPEDMMEPWRDGRLTPTFWFARRQDEEQEYLRAPTNLDANLEILDIANCLFFEWKRRQQVEWP